MKRTILLFPVILMLLASAACRLSPINIVTGSGNVVSEERQVSGFDGVTLAGSGDVYITQGETESLTIEAEDNILPLLESKVENGTLTLGTRPGASISPTKPIVYHLTVKDLTSITLAGSGNIIVDPLKSDSMSLTLAGSGNMTFESIDTGDFTTQIAGSGNIVVKSLAADKVAANTAGSGDTTLSGEADSQSVEIYGSGDYIAGDLVSSSASITIAGSGNVTVDASESLTVTVNGSGNVDYYGKPSISATMNGSGELKPLGEK